MTIAGLVYDVHPHAKKRIAERFGIMPEHVRNWANQMLANSVEAYTDYEGEYAGRTVYQHRTKEVFLAVDKEDFLIVSVIDKPIEKVKVRSPFMDAMLPQLERELFKMHRDYTRQRRALEKTHADIAVERGLTLKRRAAAKNPLIQANLAREAKALAGKIKGVEVQLQQLKMDYEIATVKVECFIRSIKDEKDA